MSTFIKLKIAITLILISISFPVGSIAGGYICGSEDNNQPVILAQEYINNNKSKLSEQEKQTILHHAQANKEGLERAERECEVGRINTPKKAKAVQEQLRLQKIKKQEVARRLISSLKAKKEFDVDVMEVYELGQESVVLGLTLSSPQTSQDKMYVIYDNQIISKLDIGQTCTILPKVQ